MESFERGDVILGKYEVTGVLGRGGMGIVLAARRRDLNDLVALKFLLPSLCDKPEISTRFAHEARTCVRLESEHVARVYDVGNVDGVPFIVMEHLTGQDLSVMIRERGQLPIAESADLLLQACEAINEAHAFGIIHRDLKPSNLFVMTKRDGRASVKVLDFGISKSTATSDMSVTASTAVVGSPLYMSPEQLLSPKNIDRRSDVWSLGVVLYEMLTGMPPFPGSSFATVSAAILRGSYTRPSDLRPDIPLPLERMLSEALAIERNTRLPSVEAFAARLVSFGTQAGRASYNSIQAVASRPQASSDRPLEPADAKTPDPMAGGAVEKATGYAEGQPQAAVDAGRYSQAAVDAGRYPQAALDAGGQPQIPGRVTVTTAESVVRSLAKTEPRPMRWPRVAVLGVLATAAVSAVVLPRVRQTRLATISESAPSASVDPARGKAASVSGACASGATAECEAACAANLPESCQKLAAALEKGIGAPKDVARAASLYQTACDGGSPAACNNLGALYALGDGVAKDGTKAVALYTRACDQGSATSCVNLGAMHFEGNGVPKNESLGARFFLRGCEAGEPMGCFNVSVAYGGGRGFPKDPAQAFAFADRACTMGAQAGCVRTALAKIAGEGVAKDVKAGLAQLDAMCSRHESAGCESLAKLYTHGAGADVPADPLRVREYAKKACDLGSQIYCEADKLLGRVDSTDNTMARGNEQFQTQCDNGNLAACGLLGEDLLKGTGTSVDRAKGIALLKKACEGGFDRACKKLTEGGIR